MLDLSAHQPAAVWRPMSGPPPAGEWRAGLAANPAAPAKVLCRLLGDTADGGDGAGPGWLAVRPELPDCVLETALRHPHWRVRAALAERPGLPAGTLAALAADRERRVRRAAAAAGHRVALPPETLAALAADRDPDTRRLVPGCAGLPVELLVRLAQDGSPLVRAAAVGADSWAQLPPRVRTALRSDRDPAVRSAVQRALRVERPLPVTLAGYIAESDPLRRERTAAGPPWSGRSASGWCWTTIRGSAGRRRAIRGCRRIWRWPWRRIRTRRCGSRCRCGRT
ncbi:HEAT repeat domain-containing protein [Kitasatospora cheerisanensis]|uniref:HEAT repeat domain-containing protein n=1 Tax=Kitasatospora cheerisanensis TaxID=81942 RepID=UPI000567028F|nr:HEAT repeat domain-containing protein [Kitasatospora cheerisanensis]